MRIPGFNPIFCFNRIFCCLLAAIFCGPMHGRAQPCPQYPADCPASDYPNLDPVEDSTGMLGNLLVPQEVAMQRRLRFWAADLMNRIAQKEGWDVVELSEGGASGFRDLPPNDTPLNYALRPPHWFGISFQFIINKDSLAAWAAWIKDLSERRLDDVKKYASHMASVEDKRKAYMDSANYYGDLKANYMTAHMQSYQQALRSGNKVASAAYEKASDAYDKKINAWINKATDLQKDPASEKVQGDAETEKKALGLSFREATVVTVEFQFNAENAPTGGAHPVGTSGAHPVGTSGDRPVGTSGTDPAFTLLRYYSNPEPNPQDPLALFTHSRNFVLIVAGAWNPHPDSYGLYYPTFRSNKQAMDKTTPKKIKCDQIQTISMNISGNKTAIGRVVADLPASSLNKLIVF